MKMRILLLLFFLWSSTAAHAAGFIGPGAMEPVQLASEALKAIDDTPCALEGRIIEKVRSRKHRYLFEDHSGRIVIQIKRKAFGGLTITPENLVRIEGEVDANRKYPNEVEVDHIQIIE